MGLTSSALAEPTIHNLDIPELSDLKMQTIRESNEFYTMQKDGGPIKTTVAGIDVAIAAKLRTLPPENVAILILKSDFVVRYDLWNGLYNAKLTKDYYSQLKKCIVESEGFDGNSPSGRAALEQLDFLYKVGA